MSRRSPRFDQLVSNALANTEALEAPDTGSGDLEPSTEEQPSEQEPTWDDLQNEVTSANKEILDCIRKGATKDAFERLSRAQELLSQGERYCPAERAHELANARAALESSFAIYHKRVENHAMVVRHLERALELYEGAGADHRTLMATRLNLSACYADANMPSEALEHASAAVVIGGELISQPQAESSREGKSPNNELYTRGQIAVAGFNVGQMVRPDDYAMLAVAYHKSAEAHERLRQWGQATLAYTQAYEVVRRSLGPTHHLTKAFEKSARCPRRPLPPEMPLSWRVGSAGAKKLPNLPHIQRSPRHSHGGNTPRLAYRLDSSNFPSWPPKAQCEEENAWYVMAQKDRKQKQHSLFQDIKGTSRNFSGQLSMDLGGSQI